MFFLNQEINPATTSNPESKNMNIKPTGKKKHEHHQNNEHEQEQTQENEDRHKPEKNIEIQPQRT